MADDDGPEGIEAVRRWIRASGYPLEYETARTLRLGGFRTEQGRHYVHTSDEGPPRAREIDIVATFGEPDESVPVTVNLVVECKVISRPWVVLTTDGQVPQTDVLAMSVASADAREVLVTAAARAGSATSLFTLPPRHGFQVAEARIKKTGDPETTRRRDEAPDSAYAALAQVVSACQGLMSGLPFGLRFMWPVVVVDGPLFQLGFTADAAEILESVEWQRVTWSGRSQTSLIIDVVRRRHLEAYARRAAEGLGAVQTRLETMARRGRPRSPSGGYLPWADADYSDL
jgi:hypothetical protein